LCAGGQSPQGADLVATGGRGRADWVELVSEAHAHLLEELEQSGDLPATAGARGWSCLEAVRKATETAEQRGLFLERRGAAFLFQAASPLQIQLVLTLPVRLSYGPPLVLATVVRAAAGRQESNVLPLRRVEVAAQFQGGGHALRVDMDASLGCTVVEQD